MTYLRNLNQSTANKRICGTPKTGVLGSLIPSGGDNGAGYAYTSLSLPADNAKEIKGRITTWPSAGVLKAFEDTSFTFTGAPDGTYSFGWQLSSNGIDIGAPATTSLLVGATISPVHGSLVLTGKVPAVLQTANQFITPIHRTLALSAHTPSVVLSNNQFLQPSKASLVLTGKIATVIQSASGTIQPLHVSLILTGKTPTVLVSANTLLSPSKGAFLLTGKVPNLTLNRPIATTKGSILLTGKTPLVIQTLNFVIAPSKGFLSFTGYPPNLIITGSVKPRQYPLAGLTQYYPLAGKL